MTGESVRPPLSDPRAEAAAEDAAAAAAAESARIAAEAPEAPETPFEPEQPAEAAGEAPTGEEVPPETPPKQPKSVEKVLQGRIGHLTKQKHEADAREAELKAQLDAARMLLAAQGVAPAEGTPAPAAAPHVNGAAPKTYTEAEVEQRAAWMADQQAFNRQADQIFEAGKEKFGDWPDAVANMNAAGLMSRPLVEAANATGAAVDVIHHLGGDLEEAERIASLPPVSMGVELARLAARLSAPKPPKPISGAPAPIAPVVGNAGAPAADLTALAKTDDMKAWVEARKKQGTAWAR